MGKLPDKDSVLKNIGEIEVDMTEVDNDANEIVSKVSANLEERIENVKMLKDEKRRMLKNIEWINRPYTGEEDIRRYRSDVNLSIFTAMRDLVYDIVEDTWEVIVQMDQNIQFILKKKKYYMHKSDVLRKQALFYSYQQVLRAIALKMVEELLEVLTYEVAEDMMELVNFSSNLITNFAAIAVVKERGAKFPEEKMVELLKNMIRDSNN